VEIGDLIADIENGGFELIACGGLLHGLTTRLADRCGRAFRRKDADPQREFHVVAELFQSRHVGQRCRPLRAEAGERSQLAGLDLGGVKRGTPRTWPACIWPLAGAIADTSTCELLPRSAVSAGPPPLVGKCFILMSAARMNSAVGKCSAPYRPEELKISLSGCALASSTNSLTVLYGCWSFTTKTIRHAVSRAIGMKSARVNLGCRPNSLSTSAKPEIETMWTRR